MLQALGFEWPSPTYLIGMTLFSLIGWVAFRRGRKTERPKLTALGLALMLFPYGVSNTGWLFAVGAVLCGGLYLSRGEQ